MAAEVFVLPGDVIHQDLLPSHPTQSLKVGPGLRHIPPDIITPVAAGQLCVDKKKNAVWVEFNSSRYIPTIGDLVIATVIRSATDLYYAVLSDFTAPASLPQLSFEGATRKTRPQLATGALVYARVSLANKHMDPEIECVSSSTGKSDGLGPLIGGMLFDISLGMARRLMLSKPAEQGQVLILEELGGGGLSFEIAVGRNGKVWVDSRSVKSTLAIGRALQDTDVKMLTLDAQRKLAKKILKEL